MSCQLLIDPPAPGVWNMAVDEALLEWSSRDESCWWRFYRWSEPTLSLGYFQDYAERSQHAASAGCAEVRRLTGGGAILHDHELTYSLTIPASHPLAKARDQLYSIVHQSLIRVLAEWSIQAALWPATSAPNDAAEPFLCFQRRSPGDVVLGPAKIAGSAQRRRRGAVLQHGSILLARSASAPELPSLADVSGRQVTPEQLTQTWVPRLARLLDLRPWNEPWSMSQRKEIAHFAEQRFGTRQWTESRGRGS